MQKSVHTRKYRAFIEQLVAARKAAGFTQQKLADRLGRPQSFVAKYENSERRLDVVEFLEIAGILKIDPHQIIREIEKTAVTTVLDRLAARFGCIPVRNSSGATG